MERDPPTDVLVQLEAKALEVVGADWHKPLDRSLVDNLGKYRRYENASVRDLLRVIRNKVRQSFAPKVEGSRCVAL